MSTLARTAIRRAASSRTCASAAIGVAPVAGVAVRRSIAPLVGSAVSSSHSQQSHVVLARPFASKPPKKATKLTGTDLDRAVGSLSGWELAITKDALTKSFTFDDFNEAWAIMSRAALLAEKMNHHPEWSNVYNRLKIKLNTHDVNGISDFDIFMAKEIDMYVSQLKRPMPK